jgi:predicted amidohydrolase
MKVKVAAISLCATSNVAENTRSAFAAVEHAAKSGAMWIHLPEMWLYMGPYSELYANAVDAHSRVLADLSELARKYGIVLFAGSVPERAQGKSSVHKVHNTSFVFGANGKIIARYRKIHLFNLEAEGDRPRYCESDGFLGGSEAVSLNVDGIPGALAICYDLRFPSLFVKLQEANPAFISTPSAFTFRTGQAHWHLLVRARAVESQCFVFAANQVGTHSPGKVSYGHSLIVSPWGEVLADSGDAPGAAIADVDFADVQRARSLLPALRDRLNVENLNRGGL